MQGLVTKSAKLHYPGVAPGWNKVRESSPWFELIYMSSECCYVVHMILFYGTIFQ